MYDILFGSSLIILLDLYGKRYCNLVVSVPSHTLCLEMEVMHQYYMSFCLLYLVIQRQVLISGSVMLSYLQCSVHNLGLNLQNRTGVKHASD